jgi:hypothetical protein
VRVVNETVPGRSSPDQPGSEINGALSKLELIVFLSRFFKLIERTRLVELVKLIALVEWIKLIERAAHDAVFKSELVGGRSARARIAGEQFFELVELVFVQQFCVVEPELIGRVS